MLRDCIYVMNYVKTNPDNISIPPANSKGVYYSNLAKLLANVSEKYSTHELITALANLTTLLKEDDEYVLSWYDGSPIAFGVVSDDYDFKRWHRVEFVEDPAWFWSNGRTGDCEDLALAVATILKAKGYNVSIVVGEFDGYGHAWVEVTINGTTYIGDSELVMEIHNGSCTKTWNMYAFTPNKNPAYVEYAKVKI